MWAPARPQRWLISSECLLPQRIQSPGLAAAARQRQAPRHHGIRSGVQRRSEVRREAGPGHGQPERSRERRRYYDRRRPVAGRSLRLLLERRRRSRRACRSTTRSSVRPSIRPIRAPTISSIRAMRCSPISRPCHRAELHHPQRRGQHQHPLLYRVDRPRRHQRSGTSGRRRERHHRVPRSHPPLPAPPPPRRLTLTARSTPSRPA